MAQNICVDRGARRIVENIGFSLSNGEALIVTGENGSGKSTLLRALAGLLPLAGGTLHFDLLDEGANDPLVIREHIHYLGHQNAMKPSLTVRENLAFWQGYTNKGEGEGLDGMTIGEALDFVELPHTDRSAVQLSFNRDEAPRFDCQAADHGKADLDCG